MYRRDLLTAEIQKLAQALARIMGLRKDGEWEKADKDVEDTLEKDYEILYADLIAASQEDFIAFLTEKAFSAEKLDFFSQILYFKFNAIDPKEESRSLAEKLQYIYHILETKYHVINMISLGRQKAVKQHLRLY